MSFITSPNIPKRWAKNEGRTARQSDAGSSRVCSRSRGVVSMVSGALETVPGRVVIRSVWRLGNSTRMCCRRPRVKLPEVSPQGCASSESSCIACVMRGESINLQNEWRRFDDPLGTLRIRRVWKRSWLLAAHHCWLTNEHAESVLGSPRRW